MNNQYNIIKQNLDNLGIHYLENEPMKKHTTTYEKHTQTYEKHTP